MKRLLFLAFCVFTLSATAQQPTKLFYTAAWDSCAAGDAFYYCDVTPADGLYKIEDHYINGDKLLTGYISNITDDHWTYREGHFVYYHPSGYVMQEGDFVHGQREGMWKYYQPHSQVRSKEVIWEHDMMTQQIEYDSEGRNCSNITIYRQQLPYLTISYTATDSTMTYYTYANRALLRTETMKGKDSIVHEYGQGRGKERSERIVKNGVVIYKQEGKKVTEYYDNGNIWKKGEEKSMGDYRYYECYGIEGKDTSCIIYGGRLGYVERMPEPQYDFIKYLTKDVHYPTFAKKQRKEGRVLVEFVIYEDGSIGDVMIKRGVHPSIDEEACRVVAAMPAWQPGTQNDKKVKVHYTQPVTFKLN